MVLFLNSMVIWPESCTRVSPHDAITALGRLARLSGRTGGVARQGWSRCK